MQFCEKNGRLPKAYSSMKATTMTEEQLYEKNLHTRWAESSEKQIVDKYAGISIEKVPEKYKAIVEQVRKCGYSIKEKLTTYQEIMQFGEKNGRLPISYSKMKDATMTEEQRCERRLYAKWYRSAEKQIVDKYAGVPIEKVPEEYKAIVKQVRKYGYGIEEKLTDYQMVMQFCEKNGRLPRGYSGRKATPTKEQYCERRLYDRWYKSPEKQIVDKYAGIPTEKVPEEYKAIVEQVRKYGYGIEEKLTGYQMVIKFCEKKGRLPRGCRGTKATLTEERYYEKILYDNSWLRSAEKKIVDKYVGIPIEKIPEEDRAIVEQVRSYGYLGNAKKSANSLGKAVGKAVTVTEIQQANEFLNTITQDKEKREEQE